MPQLESGRLGTASGEQRICFSRAHQPQETAFERDVARHSSAAAGSSHQVPEGSFRKDIERDDLRGWMVASAGEEGHVRLWDLS